MPLISCPDCGRQISDASPVCIGCGRPMNPPVQPYLERQQKEGPTALTWFLAILFLVILAGVLFLMKNGQLEGLEAQTLVLGLVLIPLAFAFYFAPAIIAHRRKHCSRTAITILNLALGWTFLGWVICLVWAYAGGTRKEDHL